VIFIDSNVPMYLVGAEHPNKAAARRILERLTAAGEPMVTSAEVFQEILHRYVALRRLDAIGPAFAALHGVADRVLDVGIVDVEQARVWLASTPVLSARDALHAAVMQRAGIVQILSFDSGFDRLAFVTRVFD
jgi:predicted nucleic acid-binding protein